MKKISNVVPWRGKGKRAALVLAVAASGVVVPAAAAQAGPNCSAIFGCSASANFSSATATAWHDWTCSTGSTGTASTGCKGGSAYLMFPGEGTPAGQDWDVLQVDPGWCYKIKFHTFTGVEWTTDYNRIGTTPVYIKIKDGDTAFVLAQSNTHCP